MNHTSLEKGRLDVASFPGPTQFSVACVQREPRNEARLDVMQSQLLCRMCLSQYQASSAALG